MYRFRLLGCKCDFLLPPMIWITIHGIKSNTKWTKKSCFNHGSSQVSSHFFSVTSSHRNRVALSPRHNDSGPHLWELHQISCQFQLNTKKTRKNIYKVSGHVRYLSAQDAVHHDNYEAFQWIKDSKEDLKECRAPVGDGEDSWHPCEGQEGQNYTGAPQWCPTRWKGKGSQGQY